MYICTSWTAQLSNEFYTRRLPADEKLHSQLYWEITDLLSGEKSITCFC